jgi:hypothetical protein
MLPKLNADFSPKDAARGRPNGVEHERKKGGNEGIPNTLSQGIEKREKETA